MAEPRTWTLELPAGLPLLNLNQRMHWGEVNRRKQAIGDAAIVLCRKQRIPRMDRIAVTAEYQPPDRRKRDEDNLSVSMKAAIDGIRAAGVVADDSSEYVTFGGVRIGERFPRGRLVITITEVAEVKAQ